MMSSVSFVLSLSLVVIVKSQEYQPIAAGVASNRCFEPVSTGRCRARFPSFHYNPLTETCDCFIFGGCGANGNKFTTLEDCMNTCGVNPQLQTISSTCISIFGTENSKLTVTPRQISPRPVVFSLSASPAPTVTDKHVVTIKASPSIAAPVTGVPTTASPSTNSPIVAASSAVGPTTASTSTVSPTTASTTTVAPTTASTTTIAPTTVSTPTTSAPSSPTSTPGPWDHWLNI